MDDSCSTNHCCAPAGLRAWTRRIGLVLVLILAILGATVSMWFGAAALVGWVGLIVAGGGACPLCPPIDRSSERVNTPE